MTTHPPLVSVVIPVYNTEKYLAEAIDSVLAQTVRPSEIIVVDDGSTDGSGAVAKRYASSVKFCALPHGGQGAARNRGVELACGHFLAFLDADDLWAENRLALQLAAFEREPGLDMVFGFAQQFYSPELHEQDPEKIRRLEKPIPGYVPGAMLIKRASFQRVGPFAVHWHVGEWCDWYLRATELGLSQALVPEVVLKRRLHTTNVGVLERESQIDYVRTLKASLDRRRAKQNPR
jgi:glycosyltransferase involved in cell wall biosynthesis